MPNEVVLTLLQVVALMAPAVAIYMEFVYGDVNFEYYEGPEREVLEGDIHRGRLSILFLVLAASVLLIQALVGVPAKGELAECTTHTIPYLPLCPGAILSGISTLFILLGLSMFAFLIAFNKHARESETTIIWGALDTINQLRPGATSFEDRTFHAKKHCFSRIFAVGILLVIFVLFSASVIVVSLQSGLELVTLMGTITVSCVVTGICVAVRYEEILKESRGRSRDCCCCEEESD